MSWLTILSFILTLADGLVSQLIKSSAPAEIIAAAQAAVASLQQVEGSPVTKSQLEGARFTPQW